MADKGDVNELASALMQEAAERLLMIPGARGIQVSLAHENENMACGAYAVPTDSTPRDLLLMLRANNESTAAITQLLIDKLVVKIEDGSDSDSRKDSTGVRESEDVGDLTDVGVAPDHEEAAGPETPAEEAAS